MNNVEHTLLGAAVRHVQRPDFQGDKKDGVVFFLKCVAGDYQRRGFYDISYQARRLWRRIEAAGSVAPVWREVRKAANDNANASMEPTPASNTGVTPTVSKAIEEFLNGKS